MKGILSASLSASLFAQWSALGVNVFGLVLPLPPKDLILRTILWIETIVQVIELAFYSWYAYHFNTVAEATFYRYHDWAVTTPLMLFSTMVYYDYRNRPDTTVTLETFWEDHSTEVLLVFAFNLLMLLFGYLHERNVLGLLSSQVLGTAGFLGAFYILWDRFASKAPENAPLYWFMAIVWGLYGVAAMFSPLWKNTAYNILDVLAKNFYGIFLSILIYQVSMGKSTPHVT